MVWGQRGEGWMAACHVLSGEAEASPQPRKGGAIQEALPPIAASGQLCEKHWGVVRIGASGPVVSLTFVQCGNGTPSSTETSHQQTESKHSGPNSNHGSKLTENWPERSRSHVGRELAGAFSAAWKSVSLTLATWPKCPPRGECSEWHGQEKGTVQQVAPRSK